MLPLLLVREGCIDRVASQERWQIFRRCLKIHPEPSLRWAVAEVETYHLVSLSWIPIPPHSKLERVGYPSLHLGFETSAFVQDGNLFCHHKRFDQDIETIPFRVLGAGNFHGGDASAAEASGAELLRRRQLLARVQNEPRRHGAHQFVLRRAEFRVEVGNGQVQNAQERAFEGEDEVRVAWRSAQLSIGGRKQGFSFEQCRHLAVRRV